MKRHILGTFAFLLLASCGNHHSHSHEHGHNHDHENCTSNSHGHDHGHSHAEEHDHNHAGDNKHTHNHGTIEMSEAEAHTAGVKLMKVQKGLYVQTIPVSGKLQFAQTDEFIVTATTSGIVNFLRSYTDGIPVSKGVTLCYVSSDNVLGGDPSKKIEVTYKIAKEELERKANLLKDKIVTQDDYNTALENFEKARIEYESVLNSKAKDCNAIKSPINGYVLETLVSNGDFVNVGMPLMKLVRNNRMMLTADVPLRYQNLISSVNDANFVVEGTEAVYNTDSLKAVKLADATSVNASNAYLQVRWEMNRVNGLLPGSFAKIFLYTDAIENAVAVPLSSLTDEGGTYYVYVKLDENHYRKTKVVTGTNDGKRIHILEGLHDGDNIVVEGVMCVRQAGMSKSIGGHGHSH